MSASDRPRDIIVHIEAIVAADGHFEAVDENYYPAFVDFNPPQIEKLANALMLDLEKEIRRPAGGRTDSDTLARLAKFVRKMITGISHGFSRIDTFGKFRFVARISFEPTVTMDEIMEGSPKLVELMISNIVRRTLPWLLSFEISQNRLLL